MSRPIATSLTILAGVPAGYALSQSLSAAGGLYMRGALVPATVGVPDVPRRVVVFSIGNDTGISWTVTGTARPEMGGAPLVETFAGANAAGAASTQDFASVTSIVSSGATAGPVTAGTNNTASAAWVVWDNQALTTFAVSMYGTILSGSPTWQVDYTYDDPFGTWNPPGVPFARPIVIAAMKNLTSAQDGAIGPGFVVRATRLTLVAPGGVLLTQIQQGN